MKGSKGCTETSVSNYHYSLLKSSEQRSSLLKLTDVQQINDLFILYGTRRFNIESQQPATESKHKLYKMRAQEGGNTTQFECFYSENLEVIILVPGSQIYPI